MAGAATPRTSAMHASEGAMPRERSAARSRRRPGRISRRRTRLQLAHNQNLTGNALRAPVVFLHMYMCFPTMVRLPWLTCNRSASCVDAFTQSTAIVNKTRQCDFTDGQARLWSRPRHCPVRSLNQPLSWSAMPREQNLSAPVLSTFGSISQTVSSYHHQSGTTRWGSTCAVSLCKTAGASNLSTPAR